MSTTNKYLLFSNGNPVSAYSSLDDAKNSAKPHIEATSEVVIELRNSPAQILSWQYQYDASDWVQQQ